MNFNSPLKSASIHSTNVLSPILPDTWNPPSLSAGGSFQSFAACFSPVVSAQALPLAKPPSACKRVVIPTEIMDEICRQCTECLSPRAAIQALCSASLISKEWTLSAQRSLLRSIAVCTPKQIDSLVSKCLLKKPFLGRSTRNITLTVAKPDIVLEASRVKHNPNSQKAQEQALLGLLPFLLNVTSIKLAATYDVPSRLINLFTELLPKVRSFEAASAYGYSRLIYIDDATITSMIREWTKLERLTFTMPWVLESGRSAVLDSTLNESRNIQSVEVSGYRGSLGTLKVLCQNFGRANVSKLVLDCPIDEENWTEFTDIIEQSFRPGQLKEVSLWSWTLNMPVASLLTTSQMQNVKALTISAHECTAATLERLPRSLQTLTICQHKEFAPLNALQSVEILGQRRHAKKLPYLRTVTLYDPRSQEDRQQGCLNPAWLKLTKHGINVEVTEAL